MHFTTTLISALSKDNKCVFEGLKNERIFGSLKISGQFKILHPKPFKGEDVNLAMSSSFQANQNAEFYMER